MDNEQIDLLLKETLNTSQQLSKSFKNYLLYQFLAKPLTKIKTEESFNEVYNCLRNENLYFLIASCNLFEEISRKSIENNNILKDFIKVKVKNSDKYYIVCKTVHKNIFVDSKNKNNLTEFRIYEYSSEFEKLDNLEKILDDHIINQNKIEELEYIFDKVSGIIINEEIDYQIKKAEKLKPFTKRNWKIINQIKNQINILFSDDTTIKEKFETKELLTENLKLIKSLYKEKEDYTDNYLMLNKICNSETEQELHENINYTLYHFTLRKYYRERTKYNPLLEQVKVEDQKKYWFFKIKRVISKKNIFDCNLFRGIEATENLNIQQMFDKLGVFNTRMFDFYHTAGFNYIKKDIYHKRQIDKCDTMGNITSFSTNFGTSKYYTKSNGFIFVIKPNKEKYEKIFGSVDLSAKDDNFEANTPDLETTEIAFALKYSNDLVVDVIFNKNFDGEFYINDKFISKEKLKKYILELNSGYHKLKIFLEKKLRIKRKI